MDDSKISTSFTLIALLSVAALAVVIVSTLGTFIPAIASAAKDIGLAAMIVTGVAGTIAAHMAQRRT